MYIHTQHVCSVKANVKPRTRGTDPITKMKYY